MPCSVSMPFLEPLKTLVACFSKRKPQGEKPPSDLNPGRAVVKADPVQRSPSLPPTLVQSASRDDQTINPGNVTPITSAAVVVQQLYINDETDRATSQPAAFFTNAHNFTIQQMNVISNIYSGRTVLQQLEETGMLAAIHNSAARAYPPRCHSDTRKGLRSRILKWGVGDESDRRIFWVLGPAAVGKSAVAQTIAEELDKKGRLGASFFFSRPNQLDDPDWVIPTLVYQLAIKRPRYKRIITRRLAEDSSILDKNWRAQFKELIVEPFRTLMTEYPDTTQEPLVIILDGLDECSDKEAQCEFIDLISTHVRQVDEFPLRWMICSRPESHLKTMLSNTDFRIVCERQELEIDDAAAQQDVRRLLDAEFDKIRRRHKGRLPAGWPPEQHLRWIAVAASGHLGFASFILRFIGDDQYSPIDQLEICMKFLGGGGTIGAMNPLHALDLLYRQILSDVPADVLATTMRILGFLILHNHKRFSASDDAKFLNIDQVIFRRSLQSLYSVIYVPPVDEFNTIPLRIYHASFSDYLSDINRSGKFYLNREIVKYDVALRCLHWVETDDISPSTEPLINFSVDNVWRSCFQASADFVPGLLDRFEHFDFRCLREEELDGLEFGRFLKWLYALKGTHNIESIISVIPQEQASDSKGMRVEYMTDFPRDYIAPFTPGIDIPGPPFTLNLRLGKVSQVHITLIVVDYEAERILNQLREGFDAIRQRFRRYVPISWPPESYLLRIAVAASSDVEITPFILGFVGDEQYRDPQSRLEISMKCLEGGHAPSAINPSQSLDPFYHQILSSVPVDLLPTALHILGFLVVSLYTRLSASDCAKFLHIDQTTLRRSLQNLHPVIYVPSVDEFNTTPLHIIYHASLSNFLKHPNRSGKFCLNIQAVEYDIALQCLYWVENNDESTSTQYLTKFSEDNVWYFCSKVSGDFIPSLINRLEHFDFRCLRESLDNLEFGRFLKRLYGLRGTHDIKSLISVIPQEPASVPKDVQVEYMTDFPRDYIASFIPNIGTPGLPFVLSLQLGRISQMRVTLLVFDYDTRRVIYHLREGFDAIRQTFTGRVPANWPPESHFLRIAVAVSCDVEFASFVLRFIGDNWYRDPRGRLEICVKYLDGGPALGAIDPLRVLDPFYHQILSDLPVGTLPTTTRVLGFLIITSLYLGLSADGISRFLDLDKATFYQSLQNLSSTLYIPPVDASGSPPFHVYHKSFSSFLLDSSRSGKFCLNPGAVHYDIAFRSLHWLENDDGSLSTKALIKFSTGSVWRSCYKVSEDFVPHLIGRLEQFDFRCLREEELDHLEFGRFLKWLYALGSIRNKSLISVVHKNPQTSTMSKWLRMKYMTDFPHDYVAPFIQEIDAPGPPFTLKLRLGKVSQVYISLEVNHFSY